jgi:hypothetical protein
MNERRFITRLPRLPRRTASDGEHAGWNGKTECLGGLEIDHGFEFRRQQHREIARLLALENAAA